MSTYCPFCGNQVESNVIYCPNCGAHIEEGKNSSSSTAAKPQIVTNPPVTSIPQQQTIQQQQTIVYQPVQPIYQAPPPLGNSDADTSFILSLVGLFCFPFIPSIIAVIYGIKALQKPNKHATAIIGIILGIAGLWPLFLLFIWW